VFSSARAATRCHRTQADRRLSAAGEAPVGENEDRVATGVGPEPSGYRVLALMSGTVGAERAEGGGVSPALGREVAVMRKAA
jgi:hypothetical protein